MEPRRRARLRACLAVCLVVCFGSLVSGCHVETDGPRPAPELSGEDLQGHQRSLAELTGNVVIVNAWASWCGPCRDEMPVLAQARQRLGDEGLHVLGLNVRDRPDAAAALVEETGVQFPSIVDAQGRMAVDWGVSGMPQTFVVDRSGTIVAHRFGAVDAAWIETTVEPVVRGDTS
ncbi:TlpA family protein disulfide reductase [Citricoccus sp. GCM10030269]|uniref:TlpA family protein disulfide reductase n=1 Tax=Citricoccus sp. GCM10030269 TaxID=3273388 RepID=UPI00360B996B